MERYAWDDIQTHGDNGRVVARAVDSSVAMQPKLRMHQSAFSMHHRHCRAFL